MAIRNGETGDILSAIAKEKRAFARLAAAAQASAIPKERRRYNRLALDELRRLLELVSLADGLVDEWLARLDLTLPLSDLPDLGPASDEVILHSAMEGEEQSSGIFNHLTRGVDREEISALLENLRTEEEDHRTRLRSLLHGLEADRQIVAPGLPVRLQSLGDRVPAEHHR